MDLPGQLNATLAGRYEIEREIGRGGMATVYVARDVRHSRKVALKVLSPELGAILGGERFLSEIQVTANLQHPNLLPLFDSGEVDGLLFYVMPFVEGESLRARLDREKQLPVDQAVHIAVAVAGALDYAHRHGVIHRDLKPDNILLHEGEPLIADFGIALAVSNAGGGRITQTGLSLGTPQYMSPEQATGDRTIDGRTDIYSLGAVLYEMLGGEPPHAGGTAQAVIARLMTEDPRPLTILRRNVPPHVSAAVSRALEKLPADRFATADQLRDALVSPAAMSLPVTAAARAARPPGVARWLPWGIAGAALAALAAVAVMAANRPAPRQPLVTRFNITVPPAMQLDAARSWMAISPSGSQIVFVGGASGNTKLYSRGLGEDSIRVIPGTDAVITAAFSADGAWILFRTFDRALKKVPASGGTPTVVAAGVGVAAWGANGDIVYGTTFGDGMWLLPAGARQAQARRLTVVDSASGEVFDGRAAFLPSGKAVLSTVTRGGTRDWRLVAVKLDGTVKRFDVTGVYPTYVDPGYVLFSSAPGQISIAPFDADRLEFTGSPTPVLEGVASLPGGGPILAVSPDGKVLSYLRGLPDSRFAFVTEGGQTTTLAGDARRFRHLRVSPDGKRILTEIVKDDGSRDIWVFEVASATLTRVTFDGQSSDPIWSPEGKRIAYARTANSVDGVDVVVVNADGSGSPEVIVGGPGGQWPCEWTPDGKGFVFDELVRGSLMRVMELRDGARREIVAAAEYSARLPAISPDGRWIAYTSNETGGVEVYVRPMGAKTAGKSRVSTAGGTQPVWSPDGTTLYYRDDQAMTVVAAPMIVTESGISAGPRRPFAADRYALENTINYSTMPDGKRLVFLVPTGDAARFGVVVNWIDEVKAKLAAARAK